MKKILVIILSVLVFASCTMPETKIYSLSIQGEKAASTVKTDASINIMIKSPRYLTQSYIAHRTSPYELQLSRYSKWDSAPDDIVRDAFREALAKMEVFKEVRTSNFIMSDVYSLDINLKKFERLDDGDDSYCELVFDVVLLSPEGKELYRGSVSKKTKLEEKNFAGLAKALSVGLAEGIEEVKVSIVNYMHAGM